MPCGMVYGLPRLTANGSVAVSGGEDPSDRSTFGARGSERHPAQRDIVDPVCVVDGDEQRLDSGQLAGRRPQPLQHPEGGRVTRRRDVIQNGPGLPGDTVPRWARPRMRGEQFARLCPRRRLVRVRRRRRQAPAAQRVSCRALPHPTARSCRCPGHRGRSSPNRGFACNERSLARSLLRSACRSISTAPPDETDRTIGDEPPRNLVDLSTMCRTVCRVCAVGGQGPMHGTKPHHVNR